jgi:hypothetical protein
MQQQEDQNLAPPCGPLCSNCHVKWTRCLRMYVLSGSARVPGVGLLGLGAVLGSIREKSVELEWR